MKILLYGLLEIVVVSSWLGFRAWLNALRVEQFQEKMLIS
jgi:hypothetical protein